MIPVLAISAWSGTGKTTLLKKAHSSPLRQGFTYRIDQAHPP